MKDTKALSVILDGLPDKMPELHKVDIPQHGSAIEAYYNVSNPLLSHPIVVQIAAYSSPAEAERGVQQSLHITQMAPTGKQIWEGTTIYQWGADTRLLSRVGLDTLDVASSDPASGTVVRRVFEALAQSLREAP